MFQTLCCVIEIQYLVLDILFKDGIFYLQETTQTEVTN